MSQQPYKDRSIEKRPEVIPGKCTGLTLQKKNQNRISLFVEDQFIAGYYHQVILDFKIAIGNTISESLLAEMDRAELRLDVKERCFGWLARRAHSRKELLQKAQAKGLPKAIIEDVLSELSDKGYLNDYSYAVSFATDKSKLYGWGPQKIRSALYQKGLQKHYIETALHEAVTPEETISNLYREVEKAKKKFLRVEDPLKRKKKLVDFLYRKGYHLQAIMAEVESLLNIIENEEP